MSQLLWPQGPPCNGRGTLRNTKPPQSVCSSSGTVSCGWLGGPKPWAPLPPPAFTARAASITCRAAETSNGTNTSSFSTSSSATASTSKGLSATDIAAAVAAAAPAPYKWSWQDDTEPAPLLELDEAAIAAAGSLTELTAALEAAAATAPPRAALTTASRALVDAATARLLPHGAPAAAPAVVPATCSVDVAARLLDAYGRIALQARSMAGMTSAAAATTTSSGGGGASGAGAAAPSVVASVLAAVCSPPSAGCAPSTSSAASATTAVEAASARELADLLWAVSELEENLPWDGLRDSSSEDGSSIGQDAQGAAAEAASTSGAGPAAATVEAAAHAPAALQRAFLARLRDQDFLAPDLCRAVCALGSLGASSSASPSASGSATSGSGPATGSASGSSGSGFRLDADLVRAVNAEILYQLTEFDSDFEAADLGRLISGMAALRLGSAVAADEEYKRILMKAVYGKTRSIGDKAFVDFSLSRLLAGDPEARSMHYDSRWTHEELHWLPRRERDKRRILKEGWYRTKWGGWTPGG